MKKALIPAAAALAVVGTAGLSLIKEHEGVRYKPYRDVVGVLTVCYGHTGPDIVPNKLYTEAECEALLLRDIKKHQRVVIGPGNCIRNAPLNPNQRDALTSFTFNVGTGNFCRSTMALKLAARDYAGASNEFPRWNKAGGKVWRGLVRRRADERALFLSNHRPEASKTFSARAVAIQVAASRKK